ncbi:MAG: PKD domain-containing protein [Cyclobacteriaceae bacterium]|nr:PKD domain-containing protein [Cyclobacteriaceae bacterium]
MEIPGFGLARGFRIFYDNDLWYGFATDRNNNKFYRFDFGSSLDNIPVTLDLGNPGALLSKPEGFDMINHNGNWYGFVGYENNGGHLTRLDFGTSLSNIPTALDIGSFVAGRIRDIRLLKQNDNLILIFPYYNANQIYRINYRDSFNNSIHPEHIFIDNISGANLPTGLEVTLTCNKVVMHVVSQGNNSVQQLNFGNDILSSPMVDWSYNFSSVIKPYRISVLRESDQYFAAIGNESDPVALINLADMGSQKIPKEITNMNFPVSPAVFAADYNGKKVIRGLQSRFLKNIEFESDCGANYTFSYDQDPLPIYYDKKGVHKINLKVSDNNGLPDIRTDSVFVGDLMAPEVTFITLNACADNISGFSSVSPENLSSWVWDFGDGNAGSGQEVLHQYGDPGSYAVTLEVVAENGCGNSISDTVRIYEPPAADFSVDDPVLCSNNALTFTNLTTYSSPDSITTFIWNFNSENSSSVKDTAFTFNSGGEKIITLTASIPGCSSERTRIFSLLEGPDVRFEFTDVCDGDTVLLQNESTGNPVIYSWDFGDGNISTLENPAHYYQAPGQYTVSLTAAGNNGCINVLEDILNVHHLPAADFDHELPCSRSDIGFFDRSMVQQANITGWSWSYRSVPGPGITGLDSIQNPVFVLSEPGDYLMTLMVNSNYGCRDSVQKLFEVLPAPIAAFTRNQACLGDTTFFIDESDIQRENFINRWTWQIGQSTYPVQSPGHVFPQNGIYDVSLTVQADNLCRNKISSKVTIHPLPMAGFTADNLCQNEVIQLNSLATSVSDPIDQYFWEIETLGVRSGPSVDIQVAAAGNYRVTHSVISENGCIDTLAREITVNEVPHAAFDFNPSYGAVPSQVRFRNLSTGGNIYHWDFDDEGLTSGLKDPVHTYQTLGAYVPSLRVKNTHGCEDSISAIIHVVVPVLDVSIQSVEAIQNQGVIYFSMDILNPGTVMVEKMDIVIQMDGGSRIREPFTDTLYPGEEIRYLLDFQFYDLPDQTPQYLCFELIPVIPGYAEANSLNNRACITLEPQFFVRDPYPNPSGGPFLLDLILPDKKDITLQLIASDGKISWSRTFPNMPAGLNSIVLETEGKSEGNYILRIIYDGMTIARKIGIIR